MSNSSCRLYLLPSLLEFQAARVISQTGDSDIRDCKKVELGGWSIGVYRILPQFLHTQADQAPFLGYPGVIVYRSGRIDELQI